MMGRHRTPEQRRNDWRTLANKAEELRQTAAPGRHRHRMHVATTLLLRLVADVSDARLEDVNARTVQRIALEIRDEKWRQRRALAKAQLESTNVAGVA